MKTKYIIRSWAGTRFKKIEIVSETDKSVLTTSGNRRLKRTSDCRIVDTFEEAKSQIIAWCEANVSSAERMLARRRSELAKAKELKDGEE